MFYTYRDTIVMVLLDDVATTLDGIPLIGLSAPAILGILLMMLFTGKIWTNLAYQAKSSECDRWRVAYEMERESRQNTEQQLALLLEGSKTTASLIESMFANVERLEKRGDKANAISS